MSHPAQPSPWRSAFSGACAVSLSLLLAAPAFAGVTDPAYRFERIGGGSQANIAAIVQVPGVMRATVVLKNGEIRRVVGDGLRNEKVGQIPGISAMADCPNDGVLDVAIDWVGGSQDLFVTYMKGSGGNRKFTAARLPWTGAGYGTPVMLNEYATTACQNMGGGIVQAGDGNIFVGVGDQGNGPGAGQDSSGVGKIWRLAPTGGAAVGNPNVGSPIYAKGVCDPIRMDWDETRNMPWFIDRSFSLALGRLADELNFIPGGSTNFAWPRIAGDYNTPNFVDPIYSWATPIEPSGLVAIPAGGNFPSAAAGDLLVSTGTGNIMKVHPTNLTPNATTGTSAYMFAAVPPDPASFVDLWMPNDTYAYVATPGGEAFRLLNQNSGILQEPSDTQSITPLLVSKTGLGPNAGIRLTMEREVAATKFGFYPGNVSAFPTYSHALGAPLEPGTCVAPNGPTAGCIDLVATPGSAWVTADLSPAQVQGWASGTYFFVSGMNTRQETVLGQDSDQYNVPGGDQTFGCPCPAGTPQGASMDECMQPWNFDWGREGAGNAIGPIALDEHWDCNVVLTDFSEDWCGWCHVLAPDLDAIYNDFQAQGFTAVTIISQNTSGGNASEATVDGWIARHGTTGPILLDEGQAAMNFFVRADACCMDACGYCDNSDPNQACWAGQSWPRSLLFGKDGVQTDVFCGYDPVGIRAAVEREVNR